MSSGASGIGGGFQAQATSNSAVGAVAVVGGAVQGQQGIAANAAAASTQTPGRPPVAAAGAAVGAGAPGSGAVSDFAKEEIIELQEMRLSPIPSIRNRFASSNSNVNSNGHWH